MMHPLSLCVQRQRRWECEDGKVRLSGYSNQKQRLTSVTKFRFLPKQILRDINILNATQLTKSSWWSHAVNIPPISSRREPLPGSVLQKQNAPDPEEPEPMRLEQGLLLLPVGLTACWAAGLLSGRLGRQTIESILRADTGSGRSRSVRDGAATCSGSRIRRSRCRRPVPRF
jgi:hypothetical protein